MFGGRGLSPLSRESSANSATRQSLSGRLYTEFRRIGRRNALRSSLLHGPNIGGAAAVNSGSRSLLLAGTFNSDDCSEAPCYRASTVFSARKSVIRSRG